MFNISTVFKQPGPLVLFTSSRCTAIFIVKKKRYKKKLLNPYLLHSPLSAGALIIVIRSKPKNSQPNEHPEYDQKLI